MLPAKNHHGLLVFAKKSTVHLFWQPDSLLQGIFSVESSDGKSFKKHSSSVTIFRSNGTKTALGKSLVARASVLGSKTLISLFDERKKGIVATIGRAGSWNIITETSLFQGPTVFVKIPAKGVKKSSVLAFSVRDQKTILLARANDTVDRFRDAGDILEGRRGTFDASTLTPLYSELVSQGILLVYTAKNTAGVLSVGAALFDRDHPTELIWRSSEALWQAPIKTPADTRVIGCVNSAKYFYIYIQSKGKTIEFFPIARYWEAVSRKEISKIILPQRKKGIPIQLKRPSSNPVLEPITKHAWEAFATFNPAALYLDGRVHLLYRAQGYDGLSVLGYASSSDGIHIDERETTPAFVSTRPFDIKPLFGNTTRELVSGGGTSGCEDPRLVEINGSVYLIYIAFDGINPPGVALSYISKANFLAKRWKWSQPCLISRPKQIQKNWVLFPEKINGKYAVLHGLSPQIRIEYIDDPKKLGHGKYIESLSSHGGGGYIETARLHAWDNIVRGVGAPPLKTKYGWLVFYHGMDMRDPGKYKVGALLLDLKHPEQVICRALEPVLEPETEYENNGHKRGVVYVCGAVIKEEKLFVYYGAADRTSAVAMADLETFLQDLLKNKPPVLEKMNLSNKP